MKRMSRRERGEGRGGFIPGISSLCTRIVSPSYGRRTSFVHEPLLGRPTRRAS